MPICWKACLEKKYSLAGWTAGILVYMAILGWYYPSLAEAGDEMQALMDLMPKDMWAMFGIDEAVDMLSPSGFLTAEAFGMMLPIFFSVFAMGIGSRAIGGEETDGTLELLATLPIARRQLYFEKFAALVILVTALGILLWLGVLFASARGGMALSVGPGRCCRRHDRASHPDRRDRFCADRGHVLIQIVGSHDRFLVGTQVAEPLLLLWPRPVAG